MFAERAHAGRKATRHRKNLLGKVAGRNENVPRRGKSFSTLLQREAKKLRMLRKSLASFVLSLSDPKDPLLPARSDVSGGGVIRSMCALGLSTCKTEVASTEAVMTFFARSGSTLRMPEYSLGLLALAAIVPAGLFEYDVDSDSERDLRTADARSRGRVHGGNQPVSGATVTVYYAGQSGYGSAGSTGDFTTTTSANDGYGSFSFTLSRVPSSPNDPLVYLVATGGNTLNNGSSGTNSGGAVSGGGRTLQSDQLVHVCGHERSNNSGHHGRAAAVLQSDRRRCLVWMGFF